MVDFAINFAVNLDPNGPTVSNPRWPNWNSSVPIALDFQDGLPSRILTSDTYRQDAMDLLNQLALQYPI